VPGCTLHSWASEAQAENVSYRLDDFTTSATGQLRLTLKLTKQTECGSMSRSCNQMPLKAHQKIVLTHHSPAVDPRPLTLRTSTALYSQPSRLIPLARFVQKSHRRGSRHSDTLITTVITQNNGLKREWWQKGGYYFAQAAAFEPETVVRVYTRKPIYFSICRSLSKCNDCKQVIRFNVCKIDHNLRGTMPRPAFNRG
jgi:hypothetical protein